LGALIFIAKSLPQAIEDENSTDSRFGPYPSFRREDETCRARKGIEVGWLEDS